MNLNCQFCTQPTEYRASDVEDLGLEVYWCSPCQTEYLMWNEGTMAAIHLFTTINDKIYRWTDNLCDTIRIYSVMNKNIHSRNNTNSHSYNNVKKLFEFNKSYIKSNIIPSNVQQKLKTYLLLQ